LTSFSGPKVEVKYRQSMSVHSVVLARRNFDAKIALEANYFADCVFLSVIEASHFTGLRYDHDIVGLYPKLCNPCYRCGGARCSP
jgi:hypothetical protein